MSADVPDQAMIAGEQLSCIVQSVSLSPKDLIRRASTSTHFGANTVDSPAFKLGGHKGPTQHCRRLRGDTPNVPERDHKAQEPIFSAVRKVLNPLCRNVIR